MKIHEYQAKAILARYGVPVPAGRVASTPEEVEQIARELGQRVVVKAQVHVGGRGKAGGIKLADTPAEAKRVGSQILGMNIKGLTVKKVLVEEAADIAQEYYLGITVDRAARRNVVMVSAAGGVDIEEVAATTPEKIAKEHIDPAIGLMDYQIRQLASRAGFAPPAMRGMGAFLRALYKVYVELDCSLAEINPLVVTSDEKLIAADAKINVDDNALYRQKELAAMGEVAEENPIEVEARQRGLAYVHLDGDIGILGNGAGLVMTTLDVVQRAGGKPANFLDVGGGASADVVCNALEVVLLNNNVKAVLFNIFGGITRCDEVAKGIVEATSTIDIRVPLVIRLVGTREEEGRQVLTQASGKVQLIPAATMQEAAEKVVALANESRGQRH